MHDDPPVRRSVSGWGLAEALAAVVGAATLAGWAGAWAWWLELATHFRVQYLGAAGALALAAAIGRRRRLALAGLTLAVLNGLTLVPHLQWHPPSPGHNAGPAVLRLLTLNVHTANRQHERVRDFLRAADPDVILLLEVDQGWLDQLANLTNTHRWMVRAPRDDNFGLAVFSRVPFLRGETVNLGDAEVPSVELELEMQGRRLRFLGTHPLPPVGPMQSRLRDGQLLAVAQRAREWDGAVVVAGDLNTTPWAPSFQALVKTSGLHDSRRGWGWQPTWPARFPFLWLPLDHCLISPDLRVVRRWVGPNLGSDHYPVVVELAWANGERRTANGER